ncbi:NAD-dependent epimerase/dehydratase family protein [Bariatricus massiliensis]|uniref:NAD-dependent epimerase/dehydratase family protein n=1 Tax=Bariatricus massiliensis TaxID=1745713 RepID=A0ABS8DCY4_9FIRM|nr:NAD-dependent epimerase/dehydratase family protein [Bariatricus massiliensis]MCB7303469.1 NAD-dependent epimerase/dehydratase family protein [Bariatricus massiliensis]MCB7373601.1 NAD-dependent epimerase/dehydratase family protein [Bariatricus massiliensis]MCB7386271.1 NAD-dependent epimerase/dehydratase family protein [Bariatricus massiliensis]MCB7410433.1 NAD-dependent epimerase/dehydratase family protein [Bariatricus massiliensis]MCQ5252283.1 NAD-dependent epimerase/dehydratase family pr
MKILVTGANGYLGQGIVKRILDNGHSVIATDLQTPLVDKRAKRIDCNLYDIVNPYSYFDEPDVMLHLAWRDGFVHNSDAHIEDLPKHYKLLNSMMKTGLKQIAVMGSMHEIGYYEGSIDENTPCRPMNMYGIAKDALRNIVQLLANQNQCIFQWLRGYYIVGNSKFGSSIFSKITTAQLEGKKKFPFTTGQNQYDFLDYDDFCSQVAATVGQKKITGIINICSGKPEKLSDRVERFIAENGYSIKLEYGVYPDREYDSIAVWGNCNKIQKILFDNEYGC